MGHKLYDVLGLAKGASKDEIKRAYRKLAVQHHPDKGGDPEKFKEISNAYNVLSNDDQKARYDQIGDAMLDQGGGGGHVDPRNLYEQFFNFDPFENMFAHMHERQQTVRCNDHVHQMRISLADAFHGTTKTIRIAIQKTCFSCKDTCNACQGRGTITDMRRMGIFTQMSTRPCEICNGTGQVTRGRDDCSQCNGKGGYKVEEKKDINLPKGIHNGVQVRIHGHGEQPRREGDVPGDLVLQIIINDDPNFVRTGNDLVYRASLTFVESLIGKKLRVPHFTEEFEVDTSQWGIIQGDKPYIVEKKGMPYGENEYGKLIIIFNIAYPTTPLSEEHRTRIAECMRSIGFA